MENVSSINKPKVNQDLVNELECLLGNAKDGALQTLIFIDKWADGKIGSGWSGEPDRNMIGEIEEVKFNIFSQVYFPVVDE